MYKLAGNSIVVNVLQQVFNSIIEIDNLFSKAKSKVDFQKQFRDSRAHA